MDGIKTIKGLRQETSFFLLEDSPRKIAHHNNAHHPCQSQHQRSLFGKHTIVFYNSQSKLNVAGICFKTTFDIFFFLKYFDLLSETASFVTWRTEWHIYQAFSKPSFPHRYQKEVSTHNFTTNLDNLHNQTKRNNWIIFGWDSPVGLWMKYIQDIKQWQWEWNC